MRFFFRPPRLIRRRKNLVLSKVAASSLTANDISSASSVGSPAITQVHALTATDISSASTVGAPAITQVHALTATGISSASTVGNPALSINGELTANSISSQPTVGAPALTQHHTLVATDISSASSVGDPALESDSAALGGTLVRRYRRSSKRREPFTEFGPVDVPLSPPHESDPWKGDPEVVRPKRHIISEALTREINRLTALHEHTKVAVADVVRSARRREEIARLASRVERELRQAREEEARELERQRQADEDDDEVILMHIIEEEKQAAAAKLRMLLALLETLED